MGSIYHGIKFAATDGTNQLRYEAGDDAVELIANRKALDDATFIVGIKPEFGLLTELKELI